MIMKVTREQVVDLMKYGGSFTFVDVRGREFYEQEHIKGAVSIPLDEIEKIGGRLLQKEDLIVTYCASFQCPASTQAARKLIEMGFTNVADYKGGILDYKSRPLELEGKLHEQSGQGCTCCNC